MTSPLSADVLTIVAAILSRWPDNEKGFQALLASLNVNRAWYEPFKAALWRVVSMQTFDDWSASQKVQEDVTSEVSPEEHDLEIDELDEAWLWQEEEEESSVPALAERMRRITLLQESLETFPENVKLVKILGITRREDTPLVLACSSSVGTLVMETPKGHARLEDLGPVTNSCLVNFGNLTRLRCLGIEDALASFILARSPMLVNVNLTLIDMSNTAVWQKFSFSVLPPIAYLAIDTGGSVCQSVLDQVVASLAVTLVGLTIDVMDARSPWGANGSAAKACWALYRTLVFPNLKSFSAYQE